MIHGGSKNTDVVVDIKVRVDTIDLGLHHTCGSCFISPTKKTRSSAVTERPRDASVIKYFAKSLKVIQNDIVE